MSNVSVVTDDDFEELVLRTERPVIVDFWAAWCGPCRMVAPQVESLAADYADVVSVFKLDVDANPVVAGALGISSIPTIALFPGNEGKPKGVVGFKTAEELARIFGLENLRRANPPETDAE